MCAPWAVLDAWGAIAHHYRKTHLYGAYETAVFTAGGANQLRCGDLHIPGHAGEAIRIGVLICMDGEYPEPARCLALDGAELILIPTALGTGPVGRMTPRCVVPTRALENHVFVAYSNYSSPAAAGPSLAQDVFVGQSAIIGPDGGRAGVAVVSAAIDRGAFSADVRRNPYLSARRPHLYSALSRL